LKTSKRTYSPVPRHMIQNVTGNFIFTKRLIAYVFLFTSYFNRNRTNRRFSIDLENLEPLGYSETLFDPGEF
jgi:hypothetical protein